MLKTNGSLSFFRKLIAFSGPGYLVAVGYMDPGNWATDIAGGSAFGYTLLFVIFLSSIFAILLQYLSLKLGIATGRDLAQNCKDFFPKPINIFLWLMAEIMIIACDLAEVIGSAIALNLLFKIPLEIGILITVLDVLILLAILGRGFRMLEAIIITLIVTIALSFGLEIIFAKPEFLPLLKGFIPSSSVITNKEMLYIAVGILGATVMPHNLYLHSSIIHTRDNMKKSLGEKETIKFASIDSFVALFLAFFVNAAILIMSAAVFHTSGHDKVEQIDQAYKLLSPLVGVGAASTIFAFALLASGQNSTITGTMAGQIIMEGFFNIRIKPWLRRIITRLCAIIPAIIVINLYGLNSIGDLLILSQVVLSLQLSFAVFPLVFFTNDKKLMGEFANSTLIKTLSVAIAIIIVLLNIWLVASII